MNKLLLIATFAAILTSAAIPGIANEQTSSISLAINDSAPNIWIQPVAFDSQIEADDDAMTSTLEEMNKQLNERMAEQFEQDISAPAL